MTKPQPGNVPKALDVIADVVLAYRPKASKAKIAKKRRKATLREKPKKKSDH
jgi:hypothetical protein